MSTTPARNIAGNAIAPVSRSEKGSNEAAPGFESAYQTAYIIRNNHRETSEQKDEGFQPNDNSTVKEDVAEESNPEIFKLLKKYAFKDFFRLSVTKNDAELKNIIKGSRRTRGVSRFLPLSSTHGKQQAFMKEMAQQYVSTRNLMIRIAGERYSGVL